MDFAQDQNESICDFKVLPSNFSLPPTSLVKDLELRAGFSAVSVINSGKVMPLLEKTQ
jgi:hypothetical protein